MKTSAYIVAECAPTPAEVILEDLTAHSYTRVMSEIRKYMDSWLLKINNHLTYLLKEKLNDFILITIILTELLA